MNLTHTHIKNHQNQSQKLNHHGIQDYIWHLKSHHFGRSQDPRTDAVLYHLHLEHLGTLSPEVNKKTIFEGRK